MSKWIRTDAIVDAVQWHEKDGYVGVVEKAPFTGFPCVRKSGSGNFGAYVNDGDWIVTAAGGEITIVPDLLFRQNYKEHDLPSS